MSRGHVILSPSVKPLPSAATTDPWSKSTGQRGYERETFEGSTQLLPELEIFGWLRFHTTLPGALKPDRHAGTFEIHFMVRGHLRWWVEQEQHEFSTGRVFVVRPGELHGGDEGSLQPCEHYWLRVGFPSAGVLPTLTPRETADLRLAYENLAYRTFTASPEVREFLERLLAEHRHGRSAHSLPMARAMLHALLITIVRDHDRHCLAVQQRPMVTWRVRRTIEWLEQQIYRTEVKLDKYPPRSRSSPVAKGLASDWPRTKIVRMQSRFGPPAEEPPSAVRARMKILPETESGREKS